MVLTVGRMDCVHDMTWTGIAHLERSVRGRGACAQVSVSGNGKETTGSSTATAPGIQASDENPIKAVHLTG